MRQWMVIAFKLRKSGEIENREVLDIQGRKSPSSLDDI
jgi:hypothetical protein